MILHARDPYIEVSLKDPGDISDPYSGNMLILETIAFSYFLPKDKDHVSFILYSRTI